MAIVAYLIFQGIKNFQLHNLNESLRRRDSEAVERIADMGMTRRLLGEYVCGSLQAACLLCDKRRG